MTGPLNAILIEVSPAELLDKIGILEIKLERITDPRKRANILTELRTLEVARDQSLALVTDLRRHVDELKAVNRSLWHVIDEIYDCERAGDFSGRFVELARAVYRLNDCRASLKRHINAMVGSRLVEEKAHELESRPTPGSS